MTTDFEQKNLVAWRLGKAGRLTGSSTGQADGILGDGQGRRGKTNPSEDHQRLYG